MAIMKYLYGFCALVCLGVFISILTASSERAIPVVTAKDSLINMYSSNTRVQQWTHYFDVLQTNDSHSKRSREFYMIAINKAFNESSIPPERAEIYAEIPEVESVWRSSATSQRGAMGLWQIMPVIARHFGYAPADMYDPAVATTCAIKYIAYLDSVYHGDPAAVLFAYNSGETGINLHARKFKTKNYWNINFNSRETYNFAPKVLGAWLHNRHIN